MSQQLSTFGDTKAEARTRLVDSVPKGQFLVSMTLQKSQAQIVQKTAASVAAARLAARRAVPGDAVHVEELSIEEARSCTRELCAFDADTARTLALAEVGEPGQVETVVETEPGRKGFWGLGRKPARYRVEISHPAKVRLEYRVPCRASGVVTDRRAEASPCFLKYAAEGDLQMVELLVRQGVDLEARDANGASALILSAFYGKPSVSRFLIDSGIAVDHRDAGGFTALMVACECAQADLGLVELLLDRGADVNARSGRGSTALMAAAKSGHLEVVRLLVDRGAEIDARNTDHNITPLIWAANGGHLGIVEYLLEKGADRRVETFNGYTAASIAAENGHAAVVARLERR